MTSATGPARPEAWNELSRAFSQAVADYHLSRGRDREASAVESTIRTNSVLVPQRGDNLRCLVQLLTDLDSITGRRVLEVGTGFGALAAYLALVDAPERLVALDVREDLVEAAQDSIARCQTLPCLEYRTADMRRLPREMEDGFDLVIANNAFIYLTTRHAMETALTEFRRVLRPGGFALFWHVNKWQLREPFTRAPVVHLLPRSAADRLARRTGWQHNHGRTRYVSPYGLRRLLRRAGFGSVRFGLEGRACSGLVAAAHRYYGAAAQVPSGGT
jgi:ubiquinone/menaquinone biosynthesis C-methylase UbiE